MSLNRCPHCRRLTRLGTTTGGKADDIRCIDCWFEPEQLNWRAFYTAVCIRPDMFGLTGDVVRREHEADHFMPHDDSDDAWKAKPIRLEEPWELTRIIPIDTK